MTITAILPAFNEEVSIGSMVLHARQHADHVVVIDDGSKDRTSEMAKLAGAEVIRHPKNMEKAWHCGLVLSKRERTAARL